MTLRPYQRESYESVRSWIGTCTDPLLVEAATGAGKSHVIAAIAHDIHRRSGKNVLCLAPSAELVEQNRAKYLATGEPASLFSASAGRKCFRHPTVFGTPGTVKNHIHQLGKGGRIAAVIVDEAHGITPTVRSIIATLKEYNPRLRVVGCTATPYRLDSGYIYAVDDQSEPVTEANDPFFVRLVHRITASELIEAGYLTPPTVGVREGYETRHLQTNRLGKFDAEEVDRAFVGHGRKTSRIIAEIVESSRNRMGVMIFAATVEHAQECMASLPPDISALVTGGTPNPQRRSILSKFKAGKIKYLVNVSVLTTGFDAEHVDVIALLRKTESAGLLQQMIGRGLRLHDNKTDCLILDYAQNIEAHCPDGDLFDPTITAPRGGTDEQGVVGAVCETCGGTNQFKARPNPDGFAANEAGYFVDLDGNRLDPPMPAHYGRRCQNLILGGGGVHYQCSGRWEGRECPECGFHNDIAARRCAECKAELVDPNDQLKQEYTRLPNDPYTVKTERVFNWRVQPWTSKAGNPSIRVDYTTESRTFPVWYACSAKGGPPHRDWVRFARAVGINSSDELEEAQRPGTITWVKDRESKFYRVLDYDCEIP